MTRAPRTFVVALAFTVLVALTALLTVALPASAHTAMLRASPDRNATVGGSISVIDLEFLDPVTDTTVTVAYNGAPMTGRTTVNSGEVITFALDQALVQPGRYQVTYEMVSSDGDFTTGGYFFTFDPAAAQMARIEPSESGGLSSTTLALAGAGIVAVIGLLALLVRRNGNRGREQSLSATDARYLG